MDFAWSFKPIFIWLYAMFGIDLDKSKRKSRWRRYFSIFLCFVWIFCFTIPLSSRFILQFFMQERNDTPFIFRINWRIIIIIQSILLTSFMIALVGSYFRKWTFFWEKLKQLEDAIGDEGAFYRQLQREITAGLALVFLVSQHFFY